MLKLFLSRTRRWWHQANEKTVVEITLDETFRAFCCCVCIYAIVISVLVHSYALILRWMVCRQVVKWLWSLKTGDMLWDTSSQWRLTHQYLWNTEPSQVEHRRREYRSAHAIGAQGVRYGEGIWPFPHTPFSWRLVPAPRRKLWSFSLKLTHFAAFGLGSETPITFQTYRRYTLNVIRWTSS